MLEYKTSAPCEKQLAFIEREHFEPVQLQRRARKRMGTKNSHAVEVANSDSRFPVGGGTLVLGLPGLPIFQTRPKNYKI